MLLRHLDETAAAKTLMGIIEQSHDRPFASRTGDLGGKRRLPPGQAQAVCERITGVAAQSA
jgi:isocitrate/isopropylmalate dehydrogenase